MHRFILFITVVCFLAVPALAEDIVPTQEAQPPAPGAAVIVDEERGIIRFIISGKEVMRLDDSGLHVREKFSSGGTQTIYGRAAFDDHIAGDADAK